MCLPLPFPGAGLLCEGWNIHSVPVLAHQALLTSETFLQPVILSKIPFPFSLVEAVIVSKRHERSTS